MPGFTPPYVLLDDAREGGAPARLYKAPHAVLQAFRLVEVPTALQDIRKATADGLHAVGYLAYETAAAFEPALSAPRGQIGPLLWFGLFEDYEEIAGDAVPDLLPDPAGAWIGAPRPLIDRVHYDAQLAEVLALIEAGDLYQANLTFPSTVRFEGHPLALYAGLRARSRAGFGAVIDTGTDTLLSLSPELFFSLDGRQLSCRPMKGTTRRGDTPEADRAAIVALTDDPKQRAENLMIVDLMRNDMSRIARAGSVAVPSLFTVESYPTVHTMVSTVTAELDEGKDALDVLGALFPCGSITGAPKIRAIEALAEIEGTPRGPYTGAIGRFDPNGDAMFNVAIRTLLIQGGDDAALFGAGGGIVADSRADAEWDEAMAKGAFLTSLARRFDLIETMAFHPETGMPLLDRHLERMKASADRFGFVFDRHDVRNELQAATFRLRHASKVRLLLAATGATTIETAAMPSPPIGPVEVAIVPLPVDRHDFRLRHKTTDRAFYDDARRASGAFEVAFTDPDGYLTEGSFSCIFVERDGRLLTPPLARGLLPGVLRAHLIADGRAVEHDLTPADLTSGFMIGNALRGLIPAVVAPQRNPTL